MTPDLDIIRDLQRGRSKDFTILFDRYWKLCFFYFTRIRSFDCGTAEELVQEVFLRVFRSINNFELGKPFKVWLMAITRNLATDHARGVHKERNVEVKENETTAVASPSHEDEVVRRLILEDGLKALPVRQREVFEMKYYWGMKSQEIGETLGIPEGTVRSDLHFARRRMMELIEESVV